MSVFQHNPATGFRPPSATVVSAEPFLHGTGTLQCLQKEMATYRHWSVSLWWDPDDVPHCRILSPDKTEWWLISATLCGWRCCFVADHTRRRRTLDRQKQRTPCVSDFSCNCPFCQIWSEWTENVLRKLQRENAAPTWVHSVVTAYK